MDRILGRAVLYPIVIASVFVLVADDIIQTILKEIANAYDSTTS